MKAKLSGSLRISALALVSLFAVSHAMAESCSSEVGEAEAQEYVDQCLEVSPATRPPCNAENSCELIWSEIERGCAMLGNDAPNFCPNPPPE